MTDGRFARGVQFLRLVSEDVPALRFCKGECASKVRLLLCDASGLTNRQTLTPKLVKGSLQETDSGSPCSLVVRKEGAEQRLER